MSWEKYVVKKTEKFVRVNIISILTIEELYNIIKDSRFDLKFSVYIIENIETRYPIPDFKNIEDFYNWILKSNITENNINSGDYDVTEAIFIDLYFKDTLSK